MIDVDTPEDLANEGFTEEFKAAVLALKKRFGADSILVLVSFYNPENEESKEKTSFTHVGSGNVFSRRAMAMEWLTVQDEIMRYDARREISSEDEDA